MNIRSRTALAVVIPILAVACGSNGTTGGGGGSTGQTGSTGGTGSTGSGTGSTGSGTGSTGSGTGSTGSGTGSTGSGAGSTGSGTGSTGSGSGSTGSGTGTTGTSGTTGSGTGTTGTTGASGTSGSNGDGGSGSSGSSGSGGDGGTGPATVHLDQKDQTIEGFGINDMYQGSALPSSLFDPTNGIGLSILRLGMDTAGAGNLNNSTVMMADIATVKAAGGKVIGSVWSPPIAPTNCKSNGATNGGGQLCSSEFVSIPSNMTNSCTSSEDSSCPNSWATTITNFASSNGLYAMSVANEPEFASCGSAEPCSGDYPTAILTANELVSFVKIVGPMLQAKGIKVIAPETSEWLHLWSNDSACGSAPSGKKSSDPMNCGCFIANSSTPSSTCAAASTTCASACSTGSGYDYGHFLANDSTAWAAFDIIGTHEYDSQIAFPWPSDVTAARKEVWQTEMSGVEWWPEQGPSCDINDGVVVAQWIHSALVVGEASAWLWWWWDGGSSANGTNENLGNVQGCPSGGPDPKRHYTLGNFSKYIRPGSSRLQMTGATPSGVLLSAYTDSSKVIVVAINSGTSTTTVPITISGGTAPAMCTPYLTSSSVNLTAQTAVAVSGGAFMASLVGPSVTTFVCQ